jgi:hypothetical protein
MKTTSKFLVLNGLLVGMFAFLFPTILRADSWAMPSVVNVSSPSSNYIAQVRPGSGGYGGYEAAITNRENNASAIVSVRSAPGVTNRVWSGKLINAFAPVEVYVSDAGYLVTMDTWQEVGYGPVIAIYDPKGRLLRHWRLDELFTPEEKRGLRHSVSSIWWHAGQAHFGGGTETNVLIVPAVGKTFRFALTNATLLTSSATPGNAAKPPESELTCVFILRQIDAAAWQWSLEHKKDPSARPTWNDIRPYLPESLKFGTNGIPVCPQGGKYTLGASVAESPTCSIGGPDHKL